MLYGFIKNMPKAQAMSVTIGGTIATSYMVWAYYRYTGAWLAVLTIGSTWHDGWRSALCRVA